nr:longitudinals lacking protein, isoforms A/B/D/L-like [Nomia melanderi]
MIRRRSEILDITVETYLLAHYPKMKNVYSLYPQRRSFPRMKGQQLQKFPCGNCRSVFSRKYNLQYHLKFECGQSPRFNCPYCVYRTRHPSNVRAHVRRIHPGHAVYAVDIKKGEESQSPENETSAASLSEDKSDPKQRNIIYSIV